MQTPRLILASTSPARRALMDTLGVPYEAVKPEVEEELPEGTSVTAGVQILAERKAKAVFERHPDALVIGADQLVSFEDRMLGKPADRAAAKAQLSMLSGNSHDIFTGVFAISAQFSSRVIEKTTMTLYELSDDELERYLDTNEWRGCAGGYRVEGKGQALFSNIEGDRTNVQGLPMLRVVKLLRAARFPLV